MEHLSDIIKIFIPAALLLFGMFLTVRTFLQKQFEQKQLDILAQNNTIILPLKLQAFERMILFLERITPNNLLLRLQENALEVGDFQAVLLQEVRNEFYHNLAQQVYLKHETWLEISSAYQNVLALINKSALELNPKEPALHLSKKVFEKMVNENLEPTAQAILRLKEEAHQLIG